MSSNPETALTNRNPAEVQPPGSAEVVSLPRVWAYAEAARELGGISVDVVAHPGDQMMIARPRNGFRAGSIRDLGDYVGVNVEDAPAGRRVRTVEIPEGKNGVVVTSPLHERNIAGDRHSLRDFYTLSNELYDKRRAELRKAKSTEPTDKS